MFPELKPAERRQALLLIFVAALGYFVDIYDLLLFSMVRKVSLQDLGVAPERLLSEGVFLLNVQMWGMLLGGLLWGVLGDKRGRLSVLFGSILLYSLANLANAWVQDLGSYAWLRFIAGVGLAGELGAGITLVAEVLPKRSRGWGTSFVAAVGILGAVLGYFVSQHVGWRGAYAIGGAMGLALLLLRVGAAESGLFRRSAAAPQRRGDLGLLFGSWTRLKKYLAVVAVGLPLWFLVGILITFSPELGLALGLPQPPDPAAAVALCYAGLAAGDFLSGMLSQALQSRRRAIFLFMLFQAAATCFYFFAGGRSLPTFYAACALLGLSGGYWALFVTVAAEQFGTNIRATVATTVPNFVRGAVPLMTLGLGALRELWLGIAPAAALLGALVLGLALLALGGLEETFGKDLDFTEGA